MPVSAAEAQAAGKRCRDVQAGGKRATHVFADFMPCRSVRAKLRRWLPRARLPRKRNGWYCYRLHGRVRACTYPGKRGISDPKSFTFWLRRVARGQAATTWKRCGHWSPGAGWVDDASRIRGFGLFNVKQLNVSRRTCRRVAYRSSFRWESEPRSDGGIVYGEGRFSEWTCYLRFIEPEATPHRCRAPGLRRVRWVSAA
jgi:hypothetical protein